MAREHNQRKADQGWIQRSLEAAQHQRQAAGMPSTMPGMPNMPNAPMRGGGGGPIKVNVVEGQQQFFDALSRAFGVSTGRESGAQGGQGGQGNDFRALLESTKAVSEAAKQISQDVKSFTAMMMDTHIRGSEQNLSVASLMKQMNDQNQAQMAQLIAMFNGGPGNGGVFFGGGGGGGHEDGHGGRVGYNPQTNKYESYGGLQSRFRAGAANLIRDWTHTSGRHATPGSKLRSAVGGEFARGLASNGIMTGLTRIPYVGGVIAGGEAVNTGAEWLTNQRAQNAQYQSTYAGDNIGGFTGLNEAIAGLSSGSTDSGSGLANRMAELGYTLSNRFSAGGMTGEQSKEAFRGVSSLGFKGAQRDQNLSFISDAYKNLGMAPQESLQYNQLQSQYGVTNLDSLYKSLTNVSKAAAATSQSAESLRKTFIGNYQTALQGGAGVSANSLAGAMSMMTANNRNLAGISPGAGILTDPNLQYASASMIGTTPGKIQAAAQSGNPLPQLQAQQALTSSMMNGAIPAGVRDAMQQGIAAKGGNAAVQSSGGGAQAEIGRAMENAPGWNPEMMRQMLMMAGYVGIDQNTPPEKLAQSIVDYMSGNDFNKQGNIIKSQTTVWPHASSNINQMQSDLNSSKNQADHPGFFQRLGRDLTSWKSLGQDALGLGFLGIGQSAEQQANSEKQGALDAYKGLGTTDPAIEAAISKFGSDPNTKIKVQAKGGGKVVSLQDAIKYYPDQLTKGTVTIESQDPNLNGQSLGAVTGVQDMGYGPMADSSKTQTAGVDYKQWEKDNPVNQPPPANGGGNGHVTISMNADVSRFFNITGTGVNIDGAAAAGVPPAPSGGPYG